MRKVPWLALVPALCLLAKAESADHHPRLPSAGGVAPGAVDADRTLKSDWLRQTANKSLIQCSIEEIRRARELAGRIAPQLKPGSLKADLGELDLLETGIRELKARGRRGFVLVPEGFAEARQPLTLESLPYAPCAGVLPPADFTAQDVYFAVRTVKRRIYLQHPDLDLARFFPAGGQPLPEDRGGVLRTLRDAGESATARVCGDELEVGRTNDEPASDGSHAGETRYPITPEDFLAAEAVTPGADTARVYLADDEGNRELILEGGCLLIRAARDREVASGARLNQRN
jgi:hypothetical protein